MKSKSVTTAHTPILGEKPSRAFLREAKLLAEQDANMRVALFGEALQALLVNDFDLLKKLLRMLIHCSAGFEPLAIQLGYSSKSLLRMLSSNGNPTTKNLLQILNAIRRHQDISIEFNASIPGMVGHPYQVKIKPSQTHNTKVIPEKTS